MKRSSCLFLTFSLLLSACGEKPSETQSEKQKPPTEVVEVRSEGLPPVVRANFDRKRLAVLEKEFSALEAARPILPKIGIDGVRIEKVDNETRLIASFKNDVGTTVTAVQCRFFEHDASGGKPRTDDRVTFFFRDGLEPGETVEVQASEVYPSKAPGLKQSLVPLFIIGKNRQTIADGRMTEAEQAELLELRKKAGG